jgi:hypothetical protein
VAVFLWLGPLNLFEAVVMANLLIFMFVGFCQGGGAFFFFVEGG